MLNPEQGKVSEFFDSEHTRKNYESIKKITSTIDLSTADYLNAEACGNVLVVGGIWDYFKWGPNIKAVTVLDMSEKMLKAYCPEGARAVVGDLFTYKFNPESFDTVVFSLVLHHTAEGSWHSCENRIEEAARRARNWLKRGGRLLIVEYCPHPAWQPLQRAMLPVTRSFLKLFKQPLVVMHTPAFYKSVLERIFGGCSIKQIAPQDFNYWVWLPVFMSIGWLKVPFVVYPKMHIFSTEA